MTQNGKQKYPVLEGSMLVDPWCGIHQVTTWFSDGSVETMEKPLGNILFVGNISTGELESGCPTHSVNNIKTARETHSP